MPVDTFTTLDDPSATNGTISWGINTSGQIVGYYLDASDKNHGFLLSGGMYTTLDDPLAGSFGTVATGINSAGQIVGYYLDSANKEHGFLESGGTYITLDDPLATNGIQAFGINDQGQIVGSYTDNRGTHGFLLTITPNPPPPAGTNLVRLAS
jgi:probable HAF family extracellular repeat protein